MRRRSWCVAFAFALGGCSKCNHDGVADGAAAWLEAGDDVNVARAPEIEELWTRAKEGDEGELARLAAREGEHGLEERASASAYRLTALRAMAFTPGFSAFAVLGAAAQRGTEEEARAAVESADAIAARKRAQADVEERDELASGCAALLATSKDSARPRPVRIGAVRALRMLDWACGKAQEIPSDLDVGKPAGSK